MTCNRSFTWRKKWSRCWEEVRFCSVRCKSVFKKKPWAPILQHVDVLIIGAGLAGCSAGESLLNHNISTQIVEKSSSIGGRLANKRFGGACFDSGAQFFTARDDLHVMIKVNFLNIFSDCYNVAETGNFSMWSVDVIPALAVADRVTSFLTVILMVSSKTSHRQLLIIFFPINKF